MTQSPHSGPWPSQLPTGAFPGMPGPRRLERPGTVNAAFWCLIASAVLPLLAVPAQAQIAQNSVNTTLAEVAIRSRQSLPPGLAEQIQGMIEPTLWVTTLVFAAIGILIAFGIRSGRNWVRILQTVFAALSALSALLGIIYLFALAPIMVNQFFSQAPLYLLSATTTTAYVVATVLEWLPPSNFYFATAAAARRGYIR
ncbi:hypothetical protein [Sinomonas terrae]|uniref:Uncharacterized protein n=1 Tax=Sinomonas terrae TaxID=2908838 RepID=A0ABS9TXJ8_9MICC|nr:hypothetical protein [Sinomonas terrae]MCH6469103.1 hypothetical protein [Sinomonas terrae]